MKSARTPVPTPAKPYADFPLFWHQRGYWCKKIDGSHRKFGDGPDWKSALADYKDFQTAAINRTLPAARRRYALRDAINLYLTRQKRRFESGELSDVQFAKCRKELQTELPKSASVRRPLSDFNAEHPADTGPTELFGNIRAKAIRRGVQAAHRHITLVRACLDYAATRQLMRAPDYRDDFDPPTKALLDKTRRAADAEHGERAFTVEEMRTLLDMVAGKPHLRAQILLGLFAAFGSDDVSAVPVSAIDRKHSQVRFPRVKNGRPRAAYLPAFVIEAIDASLAKRPAPAEGTPNLLFLTRNGTRCNAAKHHFDKAGVLLKVSRNDTIGKNFQRLMERAELDRPRTGFKTLRAMCRTLLLGGGVDTDIVAGIMGRPFRFPVDEFYIRGDLRAKLKDAAEHIERQLFKRTGERQKGSPAASASALRAKKRA